MRDVGTHLLGMLGEEPPDEEEEEDADTGDQPRGFIPSIHDDEGGNP